VERARERLWIPVLAVLAALAVFGGLVLHARRTAASRVAREDEALRLLKRVASAEADYHRRNGRYAWLAALRAAGLLHGVAVKRDAAALVASTGSYRLDVLLPWRLGAGDGLRIAPRSAGHANEELERSHFALVVRPWDGALSGWRSYCTDETGRVYVNEGISDPRTRMRPPLPDMHLSRGDVRDSGGMRWWPLDDLPAR
jgi:hypothetical protein